MFGQKLTGEIMYEMSVPSHANINTHAKGYLDRVNTYGGEKFLLEAMDEKEKFWVVQDELLLSRNKSPHGLGGLLLWDFSSKNIFTLDKQRQAKFFSVIKKIEKMLRKKYGNRYHVLVGMCLSEIPGIGKRQSIGYTHAHISLIPQNMPHSESEEITDNGVKIRKKTEKKTIQGAKYKIKKQTLEIMKLFGNVKGFETGMVWESHGTSEDIQFPENIEINDSELMAILKATSSEGIEVGSTVSVIVQNSKTRIAVSLGTPGYLHFDGIELQREKVDMERWEEFNKFGDKVFDEACREMKTT